MCDTKTALQNVFAFWSRSRHRGYLNLKTNSATVVNLLFGLMKMARGQKASKLGSQAAASRHINAIHIAAFVPNNTYVCVCYNKSVSIFSTFFRSCKQTHIHFYITPYSDLRWKENKESSKRNDCILSLRAIIKAIFIIDTHKRTHLHTSTSENMCKVTPTRKN